MKKLIILSFAAIMTVSAANAQIAMPAASTVQMIRQDFGMGKIELTYSRPSIKGRKLFSDNSELAPLGKMWRTGANASTKLKFTDPVSIGGKAIDTGTYVLYTIPNKNEWEILINRGVSNWGTDGYKETEDVVRFKVPVTKLGHNIETLTMQFADVKNESCELHLMWGKTAVRIPITTNIKDRLRTQIESALNGEKAPYQQAATFYYEWDKDYAKALTNVDKGISANPKAFWLYLMKARIQKDMGDAAGAKASANKTIEVAGEAKNDDYVRMAKELLQKM